MVQDMGISKDIVYAAAELKVSNVSQQSNPDEIVNYIFEHGDELKARVEQKNKAVVNVFDKSKRCVTLAVFENCLSSENTDFEAIGAVVHLGRSVHVGHYIAYVKHDDGWIYFNDNKVAKSEDPAIGKSYICFLKRKD